MGKLPATYFVGALRLLMLDFTLSVIRLAVAQQDQDICQSEDSRGQFLWLSDLHLDPWYATKEAVQFGSSFHSDCTEANATRQGQHGCDSPLELIQMAVQAASSVLTTPDFVLVTGDFARHGTEQLTNATQQLQSILSTVSGILRDTFPNTSVIPTLGNNDVTPDYYLDIRQAPNISILHLVSQSFQNLFMNTQEKESFQQGGYFSRQVNENVTILSINTVIYSISHEPQSNQLQPDPLGQFDWIERELQQAQSEGRRIVIVGHIPPSIGSFRHTQYWHDEYLASYQNLVERFIHVMTAQLFGHLHSDEFRILPNQPPLFLSSSVTPVYGSNPSFRVVTYDTDCGHVIDYTTYYYDLNDDKTKNSTSGWNKLYSFRDAYNLEDLTTSTLQNLVTEIGSYQQTLDIFLKFQKVNTTQPPCDSRCQAVWVCTLTSSSQHEYHACAPPNPNTLEKSLVIFATVIAAMVGGAACLLYLFRWRRQRKVQYQDVAEIRTPVDAMNDDDESSLPPAGTLT